MDRQNFYIDLKKLSAEIDKSDRSRYHLANDLNITPGYLSMLLNGKRRMTVPMLNRIIWAANIDTQAILTKR